MKIFKHEFNLRTMYMSVIFLLVNFTSISVVTQVMGLNLPLAFLMSGIGMFIYHAFTKNLLPSSVGISGLFIGGILLITQKYSIQYAMGGVVMAGVLYIILGLVFAKWQDKLLKYIPDYIVNTALILVGLGLIPIGTDLIKGNLLIGLLTLGIMLVIELFSKPIIKLFSMPISVLCGTVLYHILYGLDFGMLDKPMNLEFVKPMFNLESFLTISLITLAVIFEVIADSKYTSELTGIDINKEVGIGRLFLGIGTSTILNGLSGASVSTTYSESNACVCITKDTNPNNQLGTGILFILLALFPFTLKFILLIPMSVFGGVLTLLFGTVVASAIKQLKKDDVDLNDNRKLLIISTMIALFFVNFSFKGIGISSIAISTFIGIILNTTVRESK